MALAVYLLTLRLAAARPAAVVATALLVFSPAFVLYENWLMYTFPSAALLTISALLLHQFLTVFKTAGDGVEFLEPNRSYRVQ